MNKPKFVFPKTRYPSYADMFRLVTLTGYEVITPEQVNLDDGSAILIFCGPEGIQNCTDAKAHTIFFQTEYQGDYSNQPNYRTCKEVWGSDPGWCERNGAKFVLLGSDSRLSFEQTPALVQYDVVMLAYMTGRRQAIRDALGWLRWPESYPGHDTLRRHTILLSSAFMLHVHQHEDKPHCLAPIRLALAAAYHLPVICEDVDCRGPYDMAIYAWSAYEGLAEATKAIVNEPVETGRYRSGLTDLLCKEWTFRRCVEDALTE